MDPETGLDGTEKRKLFTLQGLGLNPSAVEPVACCYYECATAALIIIIIIIITTSV
jgi:hypothetical protein